MPGVYDSLLNAIRNSQFEAAQNILLNPTEGFDINGDPFQPLLHHAILNDAPEEFIKRLLDLDALVNFVPRPNGANSEIAGKTALELARQKAQLRSSGVIGLLEKAAAKEITTYAQAAAQRLRVEEISSNIRKQANYELLEKMLHDESVSQISIGEYKQSSEYSEKQKIYENFISRFQSRLLQQINDFKALTPSHIEEILGKSSFVLGLLSGLGIDLLFPTIGPVLGITCLICAIGECAARTFNARQEEECRKKFLDRVSILGNSKHKDEIVEDFVYQVTFFYKESIFDAAEDKTLGRIATEKEQIKTEKWDSLIDESCAKFLLVLMRVTKKIDETHYGIIAAKHALSITDVKALKNLEVSAELEEELKSACEDTSPLFKAVFNGNIAKVTSLKTHENIESYLRTGLLAGATPLFIASRQGHMEVVKFLAENGADVNAVDRDGHTPLWAACESGYREVVEYLWTKHASVTGADANRRAPLWAASKNGHIEVVKFLVENGADVNAVDGDGHTPLWAACESGHREVVEYLWTKYASVTRADTNLRTPLWAASKSGHIQVVKFLVEKGANVNAVDRDDHTPLWTACEKGHIEVVEYLVTNHANVHKADTNGHTPLWAASQNGHIQVVRFLVEKDMAIYRMGRSWWYNIDDNDKRTPLWAACEKGHIEVVKFLVETNIATYGRWASRWYNAADQYGHTPLWVACEKGHIEVVKFLVETNIATCRRWDSRLYNVANKDDYTPLWVACEKGHIEIVSFLIGSGTTVECEGLGASSGTAIVPSAMFVDNLAEILPVASFSSLLLKNRDYYTNTLTALNKILLHTSQPKIGLYLFKARLLLLQNSAENAEQVGDIYNKIYELERDNYEILRLFVISQCNTPEEKDKFIINVEKEVSVEPADIRLLQQQAMFYLLEENFKKVHYIWETLANKATSILAQTLQAFSLLGLKHYADAQVRFEKLKNLYDLKNSDDKFKDKDAKDKYVKFGLAECFRALKQYEKAEQLYLQLEAFYLYDLHGFVYVSHVKLKQALGLYEDGKKLFKKIDINLITSERLKREVADMQKLLYPEESFSTPITYSEAVEIHPLPFELFNSRIRNIFHPLMKQEFLEIKELHNKASAQIANSAIDEVKKQDIIANSQSIIDRITPCANDLLVSKRSLVMTEDTVFRVIFEIENQIEKLDKKISNVQGSSSAFDDLKGYYIRIKEYYRKYVENMKITYPYHLTLYTDVYYKRVIAPEQEVKVITEHFGSGYLNTPYYPQMRVEAPKSQSEYGKHTRIVRDGVVYQYSPYAPGLTFAITSLGAIIFGDVTPETVKHELIALIDVKTSQRNLLLASEYPRKFMPLEPSEYRYDLDMKQYGQLVMLSLLTCPGDGRADNFIATVLPNQSNRLHIVCVDNGIAFAKSVVKLHKQGPRNVYTKILNVLYCFDQMDDQMDEKFKKDVLQYKPEEIVWDWLNGLEAKNAEYEGLKSQGFTEQDLRELKLPIKLIPKTASNIYQKLKTIKQKLATEPKITYQGLFEALYPDVGSFYREIRKQFKTPKERIMHLYTLRTNPDKLKKEKELESFEKKFSSTIQEERENLVVSIDCSTLIKETTDDFLRKLTEYTALRVLALQNLDWDQLTADQLVKHLIDKQIVINQVNRIGNTLLHNAVIDGDKKKVNLLMDMGADENIANAAGETALSLARDDIKQDMDSHQAIVLKSYIEKEYFIEALYIIANMPLQKLKKLVAREKKLFVVEKKLKERLDRGVKSIPATSNDIITEYAAEFISSSSSSSFASSSSSSSSMAKGVALSTADSVATSISSKDTISYATRYFKGEEADGKDLREFEKWYDIKAISYLCHLPQAAHQRVFKYIFEDGPFEEQLQQLKMVSTNKFNSNAIFISKEPGLSESYHFIFGMVSNNRLLIVNPTGETAHQDFYKQLALLKDKLGLTFVYLSKTIIQPDPNGLVSCGPICVELFNYFATLSRTEINKLFLSEVMRNQHGLQYFEIDIAPLPPSLRLSSKEDYQNTITKIRQSHLHLLETGWNGVDPIQLMSQTENAAEQILIRSSYMTRGVTLCNIETHEDTKEAYKQLEMKFKGSPAPMGVTAKAESSIETWLHYEPSAMNLLMKLRLPDRAIISANNEPFSAEVLLKNMDANSNTVKVTLWPVLISEVFNHWIGVVLDSKLTIMDSDNGDISKEISIKWTSTPITLLSVSQQAYNNCGPELIENFALYLTGTRTTQETAPYVHSLLLTNALIDSPEQIAENKKRIEFFTGARLPIEHTPSGTNTNFICDKATSEQISHIDEAKPSGSQTFHETIGWVNYFQSGLSKATFGCAYANCVINLARTFEEPTFVNIKEDAVSLLRLYSMYSGFNIFSVSASLISAGHAWYEGGPLSGLYSLSASAAYMALPTILLASAAPWVSLTYLTAIAMFTGYHLAVNAYSYFSTLQDKERTLKSYTAWGNDSKWLADKTGLKIFKDNAEKYYLMSNDLQSDIEAKNIQEKLIAEQGEFGLKLYQYIYFPLIKEKHDLQAQVIEDLLTKEEAEAQEKAQTVSIKTDTIKYDLCRVSAKTEESSSYYCANLENKVIYNVEIAGEVLLTALKV